MVILNEIWFWINFPWYACTKYGYFGYFYYGTVQDRVCHSGIIQSRHILYKHIMGNLIFSSCFKMFIDFLRALPTFLKAETWTKKFATIISYYVLKFRTIKNFNLSWWSKPREIFIKKEEASYRLVFYCFGDYTHTFFHLRIDINFLYLRKTTTATDMEHPEPSDKGL